MKKTHFTTAFILLLSLHIFSQKLILNQKTSTISWTGKAAFNAYALTGSLQAKSGEIYVENDTIKELTVSIDMKSLHHENKDLKKHLRNKDFFEVKKYETAVFKLTKPAQIIDGKAVLIGKLTIKNVTQKEEINIEINIDKEVKLNFETYLDRTKYGVKFNSPSFFKKMKENAIADEFILKSELIFK